MIRRVSPYTLAGGAAALLALAAATFTRADPDLWGHTKFGLDWLATWTLPSVDPYSFTQDKPWVNHEWLSEAMMGAAYQVAGASGLALLKGLLLMTGLSVVWHATRAAELQIRFIAIAVTALGISQIATNLRPQLWSFVAVAVLALVLSERRSRVWLPPLFVLWANSHGAWFVGIIVLGVWAVIRVTRFRDEAMPWLISVAGCLAATLVTPYGVELWTFLGETVRASRPAIEEWQPLWVLGPVRWLPWLAVSAALIWSLFQRRRVAPEALAALAVLAVASLQVMRMTPFLATAAAVLLAPVLAARWPARAMPTPVASDRGAAVVIAVVLVSVSLFVFSKTLACIRTDEGHPQDFAAVTALRTAVPGRVVTHFNYGEYALWHLSPRLRVSMDGRRETVYSDDRLAEHDAIIAGEPAGLSALASWRAEYVWLPLASVVTRAWLTAHDYRIDVETLQSFVAVRSDLPPLKSDDLRGVGFSCFPN
ncbi:MAG TPA: hypothetical protein VFV98_17770 [Vicinamibacterales bacterium]|nr:hypothetical protein [Vicinamibacterales bacterium]